MNESMTMTKETGNSILLPMDGLLSVKEEWESLLMHSAVPAPFLLPAWQVPCLESLPGTKKAEILALRDAKDLNGIAFLMEEPYLHFRRVRFVGTGSVDYLGFAYRKGYEKTFMNAFFSYCLKKGNRAVFDLQQMPQSTPLDALSEEAGLHGFHVKTLPQDICPVAILHSTKEEYLKSLSSNQRKTLKRLSNKLKRSFRFAFRRVETAADLEFVLPHFFRLHRLRWMMRGLPGMMYSRKIREFHRSACHALLQDGRLRFYWLELNDEVAATLYGFAWNGVFYFYLSGFHPRHASHGIGTLLFYEVIQRSIEEGLTHFDFMRGQEEYKYRFGAKDTLNYRMIFSRNKLLFSWYTRLHEFWQKKTDAIKNKLH